MLEGVGRGLLASLPPPDSPGAQHRQQRGRDDTEQTPEPRSEEPADHSRRPGGVEVIRRIQIMIRVTASE